jgi:hypothetical protein
MLVWQAHTDGPFGAVYVKVMVHPAPGHEDKLPHTVSLPNMLLLMMTSTPAGPLEHASVPSRSVAPMIFEVIVTPGMRA